MLYIFYRNCNEKAQSVESEFVLKFTKSLRKYTIYNILLNQNIIIFQLRSYSEKISVLVL